MSWISKLLGRSGEETAAEGATPASQATFTMFQPDGTPLRADGGEPAELGAHEATHAIQQGASPASELDIKGEIDPQADRLHWKLDFISPRNAADATLEPGLTTEPTQSAAAFDAFLEIDGIKGETEDEASAFDAFLKLEGIKGETEATAALGLTTDTDPQAAETVHLYLKSNSEDIQGESLSDPDRPTILGNLPNGPDTEPGGPIPLPYPVAAGPGSGPHAEGTVGNETLTVGGAHTETAGLSGVGDVTLKRGIVGDEQDPFNVKMEEVVPVGRLSSDPEEGGEISGIKGELGTSDPEEGGEVSRQFIGRNEGTLQQIRADEGITQPNETNLEFLARKAGEGEQEYLPVKMEHELVTGAGGDQPNADSGPFIAESFGFGVEREMKESGEKGGTEDIPIGVGESEDFEAGDTPRSIGAQTMDPGTGAADEVLVAFEHGEQSDPGGSGPAGLGNKVPGDEQEYINVKMEDVLVSSYQSGGAPEGAAAGSDSLPLEEVSFNYGKVESGIGEPSDDGRIGELANKVSGDHEELLHIELENVQITSYQLGTLDEGTTPDGLAAPGDPAAEFEGFQGGVSVGAGDVNAAGAADISDIVIRKEVDSSSPKLMEEEGDDEWSTLESLEAEEPEAVGAAIGAKAADGDEMPDLDDLDLDDDADVEV